MELTLHLGAHRTGSTALAAAFRLNRVALAGMGLAFRGPHRLREIADFSSVVKLTRLAATGDLLAAERLARVALALKNEASALRPASRHLVLSEENILGTMKDCLTSGSLYPDLAFRLAAHARILPRLPTRIALAVRSYDSFWRSAYMFVLMRGALPEFAGLAPALLSSPRGWGDVVQDIREAFPAAEVILWRQEDTTDRLAPVLRAIAGEGSPEGFREPPAGVNASWPAAAAARIYALRRSEPELAGEALKLRLRQDGGAGDPAAPDVFTDRQAEELRAKYRKDCKNLQDMGLRMVAGMTGAAA
ncbi:MAG: hypothetical protein RLZZ528_2330 [Pseudomonadota bacterium]